MEYKDIKPYKYNLLRAKLTEVIVRFERKRLEGKNEIFEKERVARSQIIWEAIHFIHMHYREDITLNGLAKRYHISASYLSELFIKYVYQKFVDFLHDVRIRHATALLMTSERNILEIALEVGYRSYKTFSRVFHEKKGMTATEYRKQ